MAEKILVVDDDAHMLYVLEAALLAAASKTQGGPPTRPRFILTERGKGHRFSPR